MSKLLGLGAGLAIGYASMAYGKGLAGNFAIPDIFGITAVFLILGGAAMVVVNQ